MSRHNVSTRVNGRSYEREVDARLLLSDFLRPELGLTGTHVGCEHGVCGACTVLMDGAPVRACLLFAVQCHGRELTTVEGLAPSAEDVMAMAEPVLTHRMALTFAARARGESLSGLISEICDGFGATEAAA